MSNPDSLTRRLAALSPAKRALLEREMQKRDDAKIDIRPRKNNENLPLSFGQQRLWFLHELEPESITYNEPTAFRLKGKVDADALRRALGLIVKRHEILRTSFALVNEKPQQRIAEISEFDLPIIDLSSRPEELREAEADTILSQTVRQPFDLRCDLLLRASLIRLGKEDHILLLLTHHVASDGWSRGILFEELSAFYESFAFDAPVQARPLPVQYADYAIWQRRFLQGQQIERQLTYWREQLGGAPPLELPTDRLRPATQRYQGAKHIFKLHPGLASRLGVFNRLENATPFMTLFGAFEVLLARLSGQEDIVTAIPIANRQRVELENLIGFFVNTLVLRTDLSGNPTFRDVVRRVRRNALDAYDHQDLPFDKLVEEMNPERDLSRHPLFQVMFVLQNAPTHPLVLRGLEIESYPVSTHATPLDLELHLSPAGDSYAGLLTYDTDLFEPATIERMALHYGILLEAMLASPDLSVFKARMLSETERYQLLEQWNDNVIDYPPPYCIHELFEQQTAKTPDAIAVAYCGQTLSYSQLDLRANRLARQFQLAGVRRETPVGVCVERSLEMVVALLAILKSGGTYVPIDNHFPADRITLILNDAGVELLVLHESLRSRCQGFAGSIFSLDNDSAGEAGGALDVTVSGHDAAYIYYTSGSTGRPKGVMIEHRSVVNFLRGMMNRPGISETDVVLALTTISFDPAVLDIFLPLSIGARVVIAPESIRADGDKLLELLERSGATILQATPTTWQLLMRTNWTLKKLKALIGGEILTPELARDILSRCGELWNIYGPTETTVWSTAGRIERSDDITIGRPIPNQRAYIVDGHDQLVPVGVPGELLIGGAGLGRHYVSQPALTAERFIPDLFSANPGTRLYRTGDLCRYRPNGNLEFLGRIDNQVKIRGHRVEPGEIESVMMEHPAIRQCAVIDRFDDSGEKQLVGYILAADQQTVPGVSELREFLRKKLPDYMVPAAFVVLEKFPLTNSGKIHRKALPSPPPLDHHPTSPEVIPRDVLERQLVRIWENVIDIRGIGRTDDFFAVGGHSLMAVRLIAEVNRSFDIHLPLATIFRAPTIEDMANAIRNLEEIRLKPPGLIAPRVNRGLRKIFWAPSVGAVERFVECHNLVRLLDGKYDFYGFDPAPEFNRIDDLAEHCVRLILAEQPRGPYFVAGYCQCGHVAFEIARKLEEQGEAIQLCALIDSSARDFAPNLRQRIYWFRDGFRGNPRAVARRLHKAVAQRLPRRNRTGLGTEPVRENQFAAHIRAAARHKARRLRGAVALFRGEESSSALAHTPKLGWDALAGVVHVHRVPSRHVDMLKDVAIVRSIAEILLSYL